jgi:pimeloyl-ACP methyl ester carboxylesterase
MGHSFGGNAITNVALIHPRLFTTIVLLDPVISPWASTGGTEGKDENIARLSMYRRDTWPSRQVAAESFKKSPFYQTWDPRVLDSWVKYGLKDAKSGKTGEVTLSTTKEQEVFTFLRPSWAAYDPTGKELLHPELVPDLNPALNAKYPTYPFYRPEPPATLARLPNVRPSVLYIFGDKSNVSPPELQREKLELTGTGTGGSGGAAKGRVKAISHADCGHLVPMEAPTYCARSAVDWAKPELERWRHEEEQYKEWTKKPQSEKVSFTEDYRKYTGEPPRRNRDTKAKM